MNPRNWNPCWIRGGRIAEIAWIGKDVLAWCSGLFIIFFRSFEKRQGLRWCVSSSNGEGAYCLSGHANSRVFAFAEKVSNPRILVFSYPSMTKIAECHGGSSGEYLATAFTARDHLVSLDNYPNFKLTVWSWRTGGKIIEVDTIIRDEVGQVLRVSQSGPILVAQMGKNCGKLVVWDLHVVGTSASLKDYEIKLPEDAPVLCVDWKPDSNDPLLAITDDYGHIYLSNYDGSNIYRIVLSQRCGMCVDLEVPIICWFRDGIVLKTTFCQIRFYRKNAETNTWRKEWYLKSELKPCIMISHPSKDDRLFYHTIEGYLMGINFPSDSNVPVAEKFLDFGANYGHVDYVYPWAHHLVAMDNLKDLTVIESYGGKEISRINVDFTGDISCQSSHPNYPLLLVTSVKGELGFVSLLNPEEPKIVMNLRLHENPLDLIKFSESGRFALVAEKKSGTCFCMNILQDKLCAMMVQLQPRKIITDALLYEIDGNLKVFLLYATVESSMVGHKFFVYDISGEKNYIEKPVAEIDIPGVFRNLSHAPGNSRILIGSVYLTRQLHIIKIQDWKSVSPVDAAPSGHQVRFANFFSNERWISSTAFDGLVVVRDKTLKKIFATIMTHHRFDLGARRAIINLQGDQIIALGSDGSLVAVKNVSIDSKVTSAEDVNGVQDFYEVDSETYENRKSEIMSDYHGLSENIVQLLTRTEDKQKLEEKIAGKTWTRWREEQEMEEQAKKYSLEKASIRNDFLALKAKLKDMLDENEKCPEIERLPISDFDLDKFSREWKIKTAKDERENLRLKLESNCNAMDRVSNWMKTTFWDKQKILGRSIFELYGSMEVTNYPIPHDEDREEGYQPWADFVKESTRKILLNDTFQPWRVYSENELRMELSKRVELQRQDGRQRMDTLLQEEDIEVDLEELEEKRAYEGMTTYQFVEPSAHYHTQMESYGYDHVILDNHYLMQDCNKLRAYFNAVFDDVYATKEREMKLVRERIDEIRHIDSELRNMFHRSVPEIPREPQWHEREQPESIIEVQDSEVPSKPYVSPSQQEILDKQAAEEEKIRREMLADDFRERTLMKMMDGVLEVRWEDTIKIDVPKPDCMVNKKPEEYNAEDIAAVKKYEKDVEFLAQERERYRRILEADYVKITALLQQSVDKFNAKLKDLFSLKLRIEAALHQLYFRYARGCLRNYNRMQALSEDDAMKAEIAKKREDAIALERKLSELEEAVQSLRAEYTALANQEKSMLKKYKSECGSMGRVALDIFARSYKYRPKVNLKQASPSDFLELAKSVINRSPPSHLAPECLDYLKQLNSHETRPHQLPETVEPKQWDHFLEIRRQKIALELKLKGKLAEIGEAEGTMENLRNRIAKSKDDEEKMIERLKKIREDRRITNLDTEIQLVLKMGQIEIDLKGNLDDTVNAVLIPRSEIETLNEEIRVAGQKKIDAMNESLNLRNEVLEMEWEHQSLSLKLKQLREDLQFVQGIIVTKEMQTYLKAKARGFKVDKTANDLETETTAIRAEYEKRLREKQKQLTDVRAKIDETRRNNAQLDRAICSMNVERCEMELQRDVIGEAKQREDVERRMKIIAERADLIRKIQDNYVERLVLQTQYELLKLKRLPVVQTYRTFDDCRNRKNVS